MSAPTRVMCTLTYLGEGLRINIVLYLQSCMPLKLMNIYYQHPKIRHTCPEASIRLHELIKDSDTASQLHFNHKLSKGQVQAMFVAM